MSAWPLAELPYLQNRAKENPTAFIPLLGRVLPMRLSGAEGKSPFPHEIDIRSLTDEQLFEFRKRLRVEPMPMPN